MTSKKKNKKPLIDYVIYWAAILYPATALPQAYQIYDTKSAGDLSLFSWALYIVFDLVFLWYAIVYKQKPIIVTCILWIIVYTIVVTGIFMYK